MTGISTSLQQLRKLSGLTLEQTAELSGVSASYLSRCERGLTEPTPVWVSLVTEVLGDAIAKNFVDVSLLLTLTLAVEQSAWFDEKFSREVGA